MLTGDMERALVIQLTMRLCRIFLKSPQISFRNDRVRSVASSDKAFVLKSVASSERALHRRRSCAWDMWFPNENSSVSKNLSARTTKTFDVGSDMTVVSVHRKRSLCVSALQVRHLARKASSCYKSHREELDPTSDSPRLTLNHGSASHIFGRQARGSLSKSGAVAFSSSTSSSVASYEDTLKVTEDNTKANSTRWFRLRSTAASTSWAPPLLPTSWLPRAGFGAAPTAAGSGFPNIGPSTAPTSHKKRRYLFHAVAGAFVVSVFFEFRWRAGEKVAVKRTLQSRAAWLTELEEAGGLVGTTTTIAPSTSRPPVLYVPGYKGSALVDARSKRTVWGSFANVVRVLTVRKNHQLGATVPEWETTSAAGDAETKVQNRPDDLVPHDLLQEFRFGGLFTLHPGQAGLRQLLSGSAAQEERAYYEFLYDWRRSAVEIGYVLDRVLATIKEEEGVAPQVIGHSFGALLVLYVLLAKTKTYPGDEGRKIPVGDCYKLQRVVAAGGKEGNHRSGTAGGGTGLERVEIRTAARKVAHNRDFSLNDCPPGAAGEEAPAVVFAPGENETVDERFHSVLLAAPPVLMTPYFVLDMCSCDPDYMIAGRDHFSFASVFTFFPDNVYNPDGRSIRVFRERSRNSREAVRQMTEEGVRERLYLGDATKSGDEMSRNTEGSVLSTSVSAFLDIAASAVADLFRSSCFWVKTSLDVITNPVHSCCASLLRSLAVGEYLAGDSGAHLRRYLHSARRNDEFGAECFFDSLQNVGDTNLDWMRIETWEGLFPDVFSETPALREHVRNALAHSALFWRRIAEGTYGEVGVENFERWVGETRPRTPADFQRLMAARTKTFAAAPADLRGEKRTVGEARMPPTAFLWTDGFATGETIIGLLSHEGGRIFFDGSSPHLTVPGDGRLPANRLRPRDVLGEAPVFKTESRHSRMMNEASNVDAALRRLVEMRVSWR